MSLKIRKWDCRRIILLGLLIAAVAGICSLSQAQYQGRIEGVVVDTAGNPIEKAEVIIISQWTTTITYHLQTDKMGRFTQIGLRPGYFQVTVKKSGYAPRSFEVKVSIAEATKFEVKLERAQDIIERNISAADKMFLNGNKLYEDKKYEEAAAAYQEAIKLNPSQWGYYFNLGLAYKKMKKEKEALEAFRLAQKLNPEGFSANKELGESLARQGDFAQARVYYEKAFSLSPDDPDAAYNLGICLLNLGEAEKALSYFQKTVELKKDYVEAYYQIGTIFISLNRVAEAIENLETFLKLASPDDPRVETARQLLTYLKK